MGSSIDVLSNEMPESRSLMDITQRARIFNTVAVSILVSVLARRQWYRHYLITHRTADVFTGEHGRTQRPVVQLHAATKGELTIINRLFITVEAEALKSYFLIHVTYRFAVS